MPGRIKKKKERERERVSRELHDSYDSRKEDKRWKREGDYEERKPKVAQSTLERERKTTSAGERWNGEENSDLAEIIQPKYQQLFYI